jgi:hypothetical protein
VTRYRVSQRLSAAKPAVVATAVVCRSKVASTATTASGRAKADVRGWGPAPARIELASAVIVAVTDDLSAGYMFRTSLQAAGVDEHPSSLRQTVAAVQQVFTDADGDVVVAVGETQRRVSRGQFASMRNNYRYVADLDDKVTLS